MTMTKKKLRKNCLRWINNEEYLNQGQLVDNVQLVNEILMAIDTNTHCIQWHFSIILYNVIAVCFLSLFCLNSSICTEVLPM